MAEKASAVKSKNMFLQLLLPKAPFSPNKDKRSSEKPRSGFSGTGGATTMSIIPADALHSKSRNSSLREPTSPKVSCMGQVKHKKKLCNLINNNYCYQESVLPPLDHLNRMVQNHSKSKKSQSHHKQNPCALDQPDKSLVDAKKKKNKPLAIRNMFTRVPTVRRKSDAATDYASDHRASSCSLSQMRRLSSGRNSLSNFDWTTAQVAPDSHICGEQVKFSSCALIQECKAVSLEPRKEVNLWKRRTMAQPSPLQLKNID